MKKRKFNILLNVAILCMCVCAIAIGVYSAKTASLNVSGTIGFTAHNCKVRVLGKITGAVNASNVALDPATTPALNYYDSTDNTKGKLIDGTADSWNFDKIYFDDLNVEGDAIATDIVFTFTLTNESTAYDVIANLNVNNLPSNVKPTVTFSTGSNSSGFVCELKKDKTAVTMTLTLSLLTSENISDATKNLGLTLSFDKVNQNQTATSLGYTLNSSDKSMLAGVPATTESNATLNIPSYFYDTTNNVVFVKSLGSVGKLTDVDSYTNIIIPSSVTSIRYLAFVGCTGLTTITIPSSVTHIGQRAFRSCTSLTTITILNSETTIGNEAFSFCTNLTTITIPSSVATIEMGAFDDTKFLTDLETNHKGIYTCADGKKIVISVPTKSTTIDLTGVVCIAEYAFFNCTSLTEITIPSSVTTIGSFTFRSCTSLTTITIPSSVTSIGQSALSGCTGLTEINFNGTKDQWNAMTKGNNWNNDTGSYTIYCTDGNITKYNY